MTNINTRRYGGVTSQFDEDRNPLTSDAFWADCPIDAIRQDPAIGYFLYISGASYVADQWTQTTEAGGATTNADILGGAAHILSDGDDNDGTEIQFGTTNGEFCQFATGQPFWLEVPIRIELVAAVDAIWGVANTDTDLVTDAGDFDVSADGAFFAMAHDGDIDYYTELAASETTGDTGFNMLNATWATYGIKVPTSADRVDFYINRSLVASSTENIPTALMRPSMGIKNVAGEDTWIEWKYLQVAQLYA